MNELAADCRFIQLAGTPYEIGKQHGISCRQEIVEFLADDVARINSIRYEPLSKRLLLAQSAEYLERLHILLPDVLPELQGLADGAGISIEEAVLLQYRRELIGSSFKSLGECTTYSAISDDGIGILGQTVDLNGNLESLTRVFRITQQGPKKRCILMFSLAGLLGFAGINECGLAIAINFVSAGGWGSDVSPYLLVRHLLTLESVAECMDVIKHIPRSSSRALTICDRNTLATVEMTTHDHRAIFSNRIIRANHYLHPEFSPLDTLNVFSLNASILRQNRLELLTKENMKMEPEELFEKLSDHSLAPVGICAHGNGEIRREITIAAIAMQTASKRLHVRFGKPCSSKTYSFSAAPTFDSKFAGM